MTVVSKESAYKQALEWMREQLATRAWAVGDRIPTEPELMSVLGVGRNTVREAIKTLTSTGILEIRRGSGTFVRARTDIGGLLSRTVAMTEMLHVFEVRCALELEAIRLACQRHSADDIAHLEALLQQRDKLGASGEPGEFADADLAFHLAVVDAAHNPVLSNLFAGIIEPMLALYDFTEGVYEPERTAEHHREVVDGIADGDEARATGGARGYLDLTFAAVQKVRGAEAAKTDPAASNSAQVSNSA